MSFAPTEGPTENPPSQSVPSTPQPNSEAESPTVVPLDLTYENSSFGFKMNYPNSWIFQEFDYDPTDPITDIVTFTSPFEDSTDKFAEYLIVSSRKISEPSMTAEKYVEEVIGHYQDYYQTDLNLIDKNTTMVNISGKDYPAYTLVYSEDIFDDKNNLAITAEKGYVVGDKAYSFQYPKNNQTTYPKYLPIIQDIINSFELTKAVSNAENVGQ